MSFKYNYSRIQSTTVLSVREDDPAAVAAAAAAKVEFEKAVSDAVAVAIAKETTGLKAKNDELLGKLKKEQERTKSFDGLDPEQMKAFKARMDEDEDTQLLLKGEKNVVIEKYTQRMRTEHIAQLALKDETIEAEKQRARRYEGSVLDNQILAVTKDLHPGAVEDALLFGRQVFQLDANGKAVKMDADGTPELGKDGATPFSPKEWMDQMKETKPHWFPSGTSGSGSAGARDAGGSGKTIKRADYDRLDSSEQGRMGRTHKIVD